MIKYLSIAFLLIALFSFVPERLNNKKIFKQLYALEGAWKMNTKKGAIIEAWKKLRPGLMQGTGFYISGKDTMISERITLEDTPGGILYTSTVANQNDQQPVAFKFSGKINNRFIFENPQHDFPKRILYEMIGKDSLHASIDGGQTDLSRNQHFYYQRIK